MTRLLAAFLMFFLAGPAQAQQVQYLPPSVVVAPVWNPAADYVTTGQDEPGYRNWYMATPAHAGQVAAFNQYLNTWQVGGIVPTWQLLRTATMWQRCGAQPFEIPPTSEWPNVVQTLRYIRDYVVPAVGPVEPVSAYRNPILNACAGGAPQSSHQHFQAVDLVPLRPTTREQLMQTLCRVHLREGSPYQVGLGFYAFLRFHIDSMRFRKWGAAASNEAASCATPLPGQQPVIATVAPPASVSVPAAQAPAPQALPTPAAQAPTPQATPSPVPEATPAPAADPLAPIASDRQTPAP
ncbi:MAG: D-Ala-D-Ala carboxypeptidase family metallohydrolase [Sphingomicrobium sp.]